MADGMNEYGERSPSYLESSEAGTHGPAGLRQKTLRDYLDVFRRRRLIALQAIVIIPLAALVFSLLQQHLYQATSQVLLNDTDLANTLNGVIDRSNVPPDRLAQTQADLARLSVVAERTLAAAHDKGQVSDLLAHSSVTPDPNAQLLTFSVTDPSPARALRLVAAYAQQFALYRTQLDTAHIEQAKTAVKAQLASLGNGKTNQPLYQSLIATLAELTRFEAFKTPTAQTLPVDRSTVLVQPKTVRNVVLGVVLGLVVAVGLVFLKEALDTRIRSEDEVTEALGLPLLARIPEPPATLAAANQLVTVAAPHTPGAESFRVLRTALAFVGVDRDARIFMVTSALPGEGKSTTAANLAAITARAGLKVVLVDLDLRAEDQTGVTRFFPPSLSPGLTDVAIGRATLAQALESVSFGIDPGHGGPSGNGRSRNNDDRGRLELLRAGSRPPNPGEFITTGALARVFRQLRARADMIVIDTPPIAGLSDVMALSPMLDELLIVTNCSKLRRPMLKELRRVLPRCRCHKAGIIVTGSRADELYGYYGGMYYGYGHTDSRSQSDEHEPAFPDADHEPAATEAEREPPTSEPELGAQTAPIATSLESSPSET